MRSQLIKGTAELLVLSVLEDEPLHGYQVAQRIRDLTAAALAPSEGTLYPTLHRLERSGALTAAWGPGEGGPRRRYYQLTDAGRGRLAAAREEFDGYVADVRRVTGTFAEERGRG